PISTALPFVYNDTSPPPLRSLSLHAALPISDPAPARLGRRRSGRVRAPRPGGRAAPARRPGRRRHGALRSRRAACTPPGEIVERDRKGTRLNSSHVASSYAVICL